MTDALTELGQIQPGVTPNPDKLAFAMGSLNRFLDQMNTQGHFIFTIRSERFNLFAKTPPISGQPISYSIGPTGDFISARPLGQGPGNGIKNANIVLLGNTPQVRVPLYILDDDQWADIRVEVIPTTIPIALYNDGSLPNSNLFLWGQPTQANDLELWTRQQFTAFATIADDLEYPPGYADAIVLTMAERLSGPLRVPIPPDLPRRAREARANAKSLNTASPLLTSDMPLVSGPTRPYFNWKTGNLS